MTRLALDGAALVLGADDTRPGHAFETVRSAHRLPEGTIIVADGGSNELRWFDAVGNLVRSRGRAGSGPSEFMGLHRSVLIGDTLIAADLLLQRLSVWHRDGTFVRVLRVESDGPFELIGAGASGQLIGAVNRAPVPMPVGSARVDSVSLIRIDPVDGTAVPIGVSAPVQTTRAVRGPVGDRTTYLAGPFDPKGAVALNGELMLLAFGDSIQRLGPDGRRVSSRAVDGPRRQVTPAMVEAWLSEGLDEVPPARHAAIRAFRSGVPTGETLPAVDGVFADDIGRTWLRRTVAYGDSVAVWEVHDPNGSTFRLAGDPSFWPLQADASFLLARVSDAVGRELIALFPLENRP